MNRGRLALWAAAVAACVLTAGGASAQEPFPHTDLDESLATQFQAMQVLSTRLSEPEQVGKLVDILASRDATAHTPSPSWLEVDRDALRAKVLTQPKREELVQIQMNEQLIVELYSK